MDTGESDPDPLPAFVDDCDESLNDDLASRAGVLTEDGNTHSDLLLCTGDLDVYRIDIPAHSWVSVELAIDGSGAGPTDLDLWQIDNPTDALPGHLDLLNDSASDMNVVWYSASEESYERLAWYNPTAERLTKTFVVDGYEGASATYDLVLSVSEWHETLDCDTAFDNSSESGPCNRIMQFPQANTMDDGYVVSHEAHYSNLRREVAYLVRYAAAETAATFENTRPIGLLDMSQRDGDTPGRMEGSLRHPEGTHVYGNDIDIAYYQTGSDNLGRVVCPSNDGYFCTGDPTLLDARRTAFFIARLMESPYLRVIGVDPKIAAAVFDAADDLRSEGLLTSDDTYRLNRYLAYGDGWPFHHHHLHFSWDWESGHEQRSAPPEGCQLHPLPPPTNTRLGPGR